VRTVSRRKTAEHCKFPLKRTQWRVLWRRVGWAPSAGNKARTFLRRQHAEDFIVWLHKRDAAHGRALVTLESRPACFGPWIEVTR
jgi:hypothetical protein